MNYGPTEKFGVLRNHEYSSFQSILFDLPQTLNHQPPTCFHDLHLSEILTNLTAGRKNMNSSRCSTPR